MSVKSLDSKGRWRNKTVAFRMSLQESDELDMRVKLSGLTKQEYLINRALEKEIIVNGNPKVYIALKKSLEQVLNELKAIDKNNPSDELLETINLINQTLCGMKCNEKNGQIKKTAFDSSAATDEKQPLINSTNIITEKDSICNSQNSRDIFAVADCSEHRFCKATAPKPDGKAERGNPFNPDNQEGEI